MKLRIYCTLCKPEYEVVARAGLLMTHCLCGNVVVEWDVITGAGRSGAVVIPVAERRPVRVNSFDSKGYRVDKEV